VFSTITILHNPELLYTHTHTQRLLLLHATITISVIKKLVALSFSFSHLPLQQDEEFYTLLNYFKDPPQDEDMIGVSTEMVTNQIANSTVWLKSLN